jgi:uncharacterized protein (DUF983 family)
MTRSWKLAMARGLRSRCPACGQGHLFRAYIKVADVCDHCGEELHHHKADDAPPYFTMMIVGHVLIPVVVIVERVWHPNMAMQLLAWLPTTLLMTIGLLQPVKGAIVGLQWALRMHGFGSEPNA